MSFFFAASRFPCGTCCLFIPFVSTESWTVTYNKNVCLGSRAARVGGSLEASRRCTCMCHICRRIKYYLDEVPLPVFVDGGNAPVVVLSQENDWATMRFSYLLNFFELEKLSVLVHVFMFFPKFWVLRTIRKISGSFLTRGQLCSHYFPLGSIENL